MGRVDNGAALSTMQRLRIIMMTRIALLLMFSLLAACSFEVQPEPQGAWNEWVCDSQIKVYWRILMDRHQLFGQQNPVAVITK